MKIPLHIAEKLLQLLKGESISSSSAKHPLMDELVNDGILQRIGRIQKKVALTDKNGLYTYLKNHYSIDDLEEYIQICTKENVTRSELVAVSSDSKLTKVRTFKGFLVNCYEPILALGVILL